MTACQNSPPPTTNDDYNQPVTEGISLNNATLEQSNNDGVNFWRLRVEKVTYSDNNRIANIENITGNLFQDGEVVVKFQANQGMVTNDGEEIILEGDIFAVDTRNQIEIRGDKLTWQPQEKYFLMKDHIQVIRQNIQLKSQEVKYYTEVEILEVSQDVITRYLNENLILKTKELTWQIRENLVNIPNFLVINRLNEEQIIEYLTANQGKLNLEQKQVFLSENVVYESMESSLQASSESMVWNYQERIINTDQKISIIDTEREMIVMGNQGKINLTDNQILLSNKVYGESNKNQGKIYADSLQWDINSENIIASGNVIYEQINPELSFTGKRAEGSLSNQTIIVTGESNQRVVTTIIP